MDSRATYSYSRNVLIHFKNKNKNKIKILVTGNYLDKRFGVNLGQFKKDGIKIDEKIKFKSPKIEKNSWSLSLGNAIKEFSKKLKKINPSLVVVTGDRIETLGMTLAAAYMNISIAHIQAGDKSGHIDDLSRSAIAKYSNIHFSSCKDSSKRLKRWGEKDSRIFEVGAPQLDDIKKISNVKKIKTNNFIVLFHPVLNEINEVENQMKNLIKTLKKFNNKIYWIYPNNDFGFQLILKLLKKNNLKNITIIKNLDRDKFIDLLSTSKLLIGNSSCGIIEAASFRLPVINIGTRQAGRPQSKNILNSSYECTEIERQINYALSKKFQIKCNTVKNLYFKRNSGYLIFKVLNQLNTNSKILKKY
jgi:GDP/UDP-N,N'-diacetylbacillosamine 2-epimerase (hydrolysing)